MTTSTNNNATKKSNFFQAALDENSKPPVYPLLISDDTEGFKKHKGDFLNAVKIAIDGIKPLYNELKLDEPFDDDTWRLMCQGKNIVSERYAAKAKRLEDLIGVTGGLTAGEIIKRRHPNIEDIRNRINSLPRDLQFVWNYSNASLRPQDVINVNTKPELSPVAETNFRQAYMFYVNNDQELNIKQVLDSFASDYNRFVRSLKNLGYGPYINTIANTYLPNFFDENSDYSLKTNPSAVSFLAKFSNQQSKIVIA